jgi:hypothetical protein
MRKVWFFRATKSRSQRAFKWLKWGIFSNLLLTKHYVSAAGRGKKLFSGRILVVEPNNFANRTVASSFTDRLSVDEIMDRMRFDLIIQRGKQALGLGFTSVGDLIPGYLAELEAKNINVFISDKANPLLPPYKSQDEKANIQQMREWLEREFIG